MLFLTPSIYGHHGRIFLKARTGNSQQLAKTRILPYFGELTPKSNGMGFKQGFWLENTWIYVQYSVFLKMFLCSLKDILSFLVFCVWKIFCLFWCFVFGRYSILFLCFAFERYSILFLCLFFKYILFCFCVCVLKTFYLFSVCNVTSSIEGFLACWSFVSPPFTGDCTE